MSSAKEWKKLEEFFTLSKAPCSYCFGTPIEVYIGEKEPDDTTRGFIVYDNSFKYNPSNGQNCWIRFTGINPLQLLGGKA